MIKIKIKIKNIILVIKCFLGETTENNIVVRENTEVLILKELKIKIKAIFKCSTCIGK